MTSSAGMMKDILSKAKLNKRAKEAVQMGPAYESTKTGIQYWDAVMSELETRKGAYEKGIKEFKAAGGTGSTENNIIKVELKNISAEVELDQDNRMSVANMTIADGDKLLVWGNEVDSIGDVKKIAKELVAMFATVAEEDTVKEIEGNVSILTNGIVSMFGINGSEEAHKMAEELRNFLENDGYIKGMNSMANNHILQSDPLTAMSFIPDDIKQKEKVQG